MDPFHQSFTLLLADGTPFNITLTDLNSFNLYNVRLSINCGSQIGASLLLLVVLALITQPDKRRSLIFIVNFLALLFNLIRSLLQSLYAASGFSVVYAYFSGNFSRVSASDYGSSVAADIFTLLVLICIETSLVIQIEIVCATMRNTYRQAVIAGSIVVALIAIGFRTALISENIKSVLKAENFASWKWLASATNITTTISICIFCAIFAAKLGVAMHERKKLRLRQFGPMRILFIMGCQTMFVPGRCAQRPNLVMCFKLICKQPSLHFYSTLLIHRSLGRTF